MMKADQTDCGSVISVGGNDGLAKEMWSVSWFLQRDKCMLFLGFQLMKIVFLAMVRAMRRSLFLVLINVLAGKVREIMG